MKKLLSVLAALLPISALALDPVVASFTAPNTDIILTNNSTILYGATNVEYIGPGGLLQWSLGTNYVVPVYVGGTTVNGFNYGGTAYYTNTILTNATLFNAAWQDVHLWPNAAADSAQCPITLFVVGSTDSTLSTNLLTLTFFRMYGTNVDTGTTAGSGANTFVCAIPLTGTTNCVGSTNLTAVFQYGATGLRLAKAVLANSSTNVISHVYNIGLSGFRP